MCLNVCVSARPCPELKPWQEHRSAEKIWKKNTIHSLRHTRTDIVWEDYKEHLHIGWTQDKHNALYALDKFFLVSQKLNVHTHKHTSKLHLSVQSRASQRLSQKGVTHQESFQWKSCCQSTGKIKSCPLLCSCVQLPRHTAGSVHEWRWRHLQPL